MVNVVVGSDFGNLQICYLSPQLGTSVCCGVYAVPSNSEKITHRVRQRPRMFYPFYCYLFYLFIYLLLLYFCFYLYIFIILYFNLVNVLFISYVTCIFFNSLYLLSFRIFAISSDLWCYSIGTFCFVYFRQCIFIHYIAIT